MDAISNHQSLTTEQNVIIIIIMSPTNLDHTVVQRLKTNKNSFLSHTNEQQIMLTTSHMYNIIANSKLVKNLHVELNCTQITTLMA
jgi:hypothetical protein